MSNIKILWADDEIDILRPQLIFLEKKGYDVVTVTNGHDALEEVESNADIDVVFLDESMPGLSGLETLSQIKALKPNLPVVMITKSEAEDIMEEAIGSQIHDYLIKPVNPHQILLALKKIIDNKRLVSERINTQYQQQFRQILMDINSGPDLQEWKDIYKGIVNWEIKLGKSESDDMHDILAMQKEQANIEFSKFIKRNYLDWMDDKNEEGPIMSHNLMKEKIFPQIDKSRPTVMLLLDNLRYDQWKVIEPIVNSLFRVEEEDHFFSLLPTATQYSRNAIFAGLTPAQIAKHYPQWWKNDFEEGSKNKFEAELLGKQIEHTYRKPLKWHYTKITNVNQAKKLQDKILDLTNFDFSVIVYNFIDMISHARTEMEVLKELAGDERAYRSLTESWFLHSPLWLGLQKLAERDIQLFITTDHGTIRVQSPSKVIGDRETTTNLRYKVGRNLKYDKRDVLEIANPHEAGLPRPNVSSRFIFALENKYFLYPNSYNYYMNYYRDTFQHGGISLEEVICPIVRLSSR